ANMQFHALDVEFVGASGAAHPVGDDVRLPRVSYFNGPPANWKRGLRTYGKVVYHQIWPGIELLYGSGTNQMEYTFVVQPGADPKKIQMAYNGASSLQIDAKGQLQISTPLGELTESAPVAYQDIGKKRVAVSAAFSLGAGNTYSFQLGAYDK